MKSSYIIDKLYREHAELEAAIQREMARPRPKGEVIRDLKRQKLRIKDQLSMGRAA